MAASPHDATLISGNIEHHISGRNLMSACVGSWIGSFAGRLVDRRPGSEDCE
jgi:hypothetical protein